MDNAMDRKDNCRKVQEGNSVLSFRVGPFLVKDNDSLWRGDTLVPLSPLQLRLFCFLCRHPQQVVEKAQIVCAVWGHNDVSDVSLARAVHGLRVRLAQAGRPSEMIRNIYGRGYILTQPVLVVEEDPSGEPRPPAVASTAAPVPASAAEGSTQQHPSPPVAPANR